MVSDGMLNAMAQAASDEIAGAKYYIGDTAYTGTIESKNVNGNRLDVTIGITDGDASDVIDTFQLIDDNGQVIAEKEDSVGRTEAESILYLFTLIIDNREEE